MSGTPNSVPFSISAAPSWVTGATNAQWAQIPGTATGTLNAAGADDNCGDAWTAHAYDIDKQIIYNAAQGGHVAPGPGCTAYRLRLNNSSCAWEAVVATPSTQDALDALPGDTSSYGGRAFNLTGQNSDGTKSSDHSYNMCQYARGKVWFPAFCAGYFSGGDGPASTAAWSWNPAAATNSTKGYSFLGLTTPGLMQFGGGRPVESGCDYDPVTASIWALYQTWFNNDSTSQSLVQINTVTNTCRSYELTGMTSTDCIPMQVVIHPVTRIMWLIGQMGLGYIDLSTVTPGTAVTATLATESGTPIRTDSAGVAFHQAANSGQGSIYVFDDSNSSLHKIALPASPSSTVAWSSITTTGTAPSSAQNGTWKKMGFMPNIGGNALIVLQGSYSGSVAGGAVRSATSFMKVPSGGL